jgi:hypothetical protein
LTSAAADVTLVLFWTSLGVSAVVVLIFLWLMREDRSKSVRHEAKGEATPSAEGREDPAPRA